MRAFLFICLLFPVLLWGQTTDPVLDSLKQSLPPNASVRAQAERLEAILFYTQDDRYDLPHYSRYLDSLFHCCILGKTGDPTFEHRIEGELPLFQGLTLLYAEPEKAKILFESSLRTCSAYRDSAGLSVAYSYLGQVASAMGDSLAFAAVYPKSLALSRHIKAPYVQATVYSNLSISCFDFGRFAESAALSFQVLDLIDRHPTPDMLEGKASTLINIAATYTRLGDNPNARLFTEKALEVAKARHQNMPEIFTHLGWTLIVDKEYRKALEIYKTVQNIPEDQQTFNVLAASTYGMALCYRKLGDLQKALPLARKGVEVLTIEKHASFGAAAMLELANCEFEANLKEAALPHALLAYQTFTKAKNNGGGVESCELLAAIYKSKGDYRKALEYSELRYKYQSQIERQQSNRQLAFGEFTRDNAAKTARREAEVQAQLTQQRNIRYALLVGLAVLALIAFLLYNRYRLKRRSAAQLEAKNREVEAARARAEASEAFKARFLAHMSHEIRTPLHGIAGFTDLLLETALSEKQRRWLSSIHHSTDRLGEVVNDILDLSKLEAGAMRLRQVPLSPARVAADVQESLALRAESKGIALRLDIAENLPPAVLGDPTRLYQILMNLVGNAVKFTEQGEVRLRVEGAAPSTLHLLPSTLIFKVSDTGIGIPPQQLDNVFGSFQQAGEDTTARFGGTGLGLTIARELVQLHGSDIRVESEVGKGSTFSFSIAFPLANTAELEQETPGNDALYFTAPLKILLADDNALNREIAAEALRRHFDKVEIVEAADGRKATQRAQQEPFDLILMDLQMPEMSGLEATRYIRQHISMEVPIIALTASATPEEIDSALAAGMNRHLSKPFKPQELARAIAEVLGLATFRKLETFGKVESSSFLRDFCEGDEVQMEYFIQKFLAQYPLEIKRLKAAWQDKDREALYRAAHSLKPQLEFVGLAEAKAWAAAIEQGAHSGMDWEEIGLWIGKLQGLQPRFYPLS